MNEKEKHPWRAFLEARAKVILLMSKEGEKTDNQIARELSVDEEQVMQIRKYMEMMEDCKK